MKQAEVSQDTSAQLEAIIDIGLTYAMTAEYDSSLNYYKYRLPLAEAYGKEKDIARTLMNIATVNSARGEYGNSLPRLNEALRNHQLLNDSMAVAACLANMASVYEHLEERDKAKNSYQAAIDIASIARHRAKVFHPHCMASPRLPQMKAGISNLFL